MEPGCIETYFGLNLGEFVHLDSAKKSPKIREGFSNSSEFRRKAEIREVVGALI